MQRSRTIVARILLDPGPSGPHDLEWLDAVLAQARQVDRGDAGQALRLAAALELPYPGGGRTSRLWEALATLGSVDLQLARAVEPHVDAVTIRHEAGLSTPARTTWGVFAAEQPGLRLEARRRDGAWTLHGTKPWCSLASELSHALVTAWVDDERRGLFSVQLAHESVDRAPGSWVARGLSGVVSSPVHFEGTEATPVGAPGWYLARDGFAYGGIGVAAVWYGATVAIGRRVSAAAHTRPPDQIGLMHLGAIDTALATARNALATAARAVDGGRARGPEGSFLALRTRQAVFDAAETVLRRADHALGPGPLVTEEEHAARVADLHLYLRQHHGERDLATLGREIAERDPW